MCKLCNGELGVLGVLGTMVHLRCRDCGMLFTIQSEDFGDLIAAEMPEEYDEDDDYL